MNDDQRQVLRQINQRTVLRQIKNAIDSAREEGVVVEYPHGVLIDGVWVDWPFDGVKEASKREPT